MSRDPDIIEIGAETSLGLKIGFTAEHFRSSSFLRRDGDRIIMSYLLPKGTYGKRELAQEIRRAGFRPATLDLGTGLVEDFA